MSFPAGNLVFPAFLGGFPPGQGHLPQLKHLMVTSGGIMEVDAPEVT